MVLGIGFCRSCHVLLSVHLAPSSMAEYGAVMPVICMIWRPCYGPYPCSPHAPHAPCSRVLFFFLFRSSPPSPSLFRPPLSRPQCFRTFSSLLASCWGHTRPLLNHNKPRTRLHQMPPPPRLPCRAGSFVLLLSTLSSSLSKQGQRATAPWGSKQQQP